MNANAQKYGPIRKTTHQIVVIGILFRSVAL